MKLFITGTDTDAGKTYMSVGLLRLFNQAGLKTIGLKPMASGCDENNQNADALALQREASIQIDYDSVNPYAFKQAIAPHIAAARNNMLITATDVIEKMNPSLKIPADIHIIEGAGGWYTPINLTETLADVVKKLNLPVILVVNIRLGCINHALLTARAIQHDGVTMLGWIANVATPEYLERDEVIATLNDYLPGYFFGTVNYNEKPEDKLSSILQNLRIAR